MHRGILFFLLVLPALTARTLLAQESAQPQFAVVTVEKSAGLGASPDDTLQIVAALLNACHRELVSPGRCITSESQTPGLLQGASEKHLVVSVAKLDEVYVVKLKRLDTLTGLTDSEIRDTSSGGLAPLLAHQREWVRKLFPEFVKQPRAPLTKAWWFWAGLALSAGALAVGGLAWKNARDDQFDRKIELP